MRLCKNKKLINMVIQKPVNFSAITCAYNEARNIGKYIQTVQNQKLPHYIKLKEILIVASGCTDNTVSIIKNHRKSDKRIRLISQKDREGKAIAVNILLDNVKTKLLILQSADTIPAKSCYAHLLEELVKPDVGLAAAKIVPKDNPDTLVGFANHLKWNLHHKINLEYPERPKVGELIAFKKIFERIPPKTAVDEASIEPLIHLQGFKIVYVPSAIIYNQGPKTIREYLSQRRRIYAGHYVTKKKYAYEIITLNSSRIIPIFIKNIKPDPKYIVYSLTTVLLETLARTIGYFDIKLKLRDHAIWKIAKTSKKVIGKQKN